MLQLLVTYTWACRSHTRLTHRRRLQTLHTRRFWTPCIIACDIMLQMLTAVVHLCTCHLCVLWRRCNRARGALQHAAHIAPAAVTHQAVC
jgi:hypothetical protein